MRNINFSGRVAIVTGAGRGLGRSYAEILAARGAIVVVNDVTNSGEAADSIRDAGGLSIASDHDISTPTGAKGLVDFTEEQCGGVDILVNNAAIGRYSSFLDVEIEEYELVRKVGLDGTFYVTRAAWPIMAAQEYGRIVMTTSGHGLLGGNNSISYSATKGGIFGMMRSAALDGKPFGIMVNSISPAAFTPMAESYVSEEWAEKMRMESPTSLVSPLVALLCSEQCPTTGANFDVGSGRVGMVTPFTNAGYYDRNQTPESILEHWPEVTDTAAQSAYSSSRESTEAVGIARRRTEADATR
ncbi:SDR family NAD(P)-dependent oxidoreductase [Rhodococcus sp. NPDC127530]|uniref:SDR family NAD(P)-dependent oxidoreductase n=1 Tax=unclassified Rhodococcus (in: high G+C Gram-positive bacteria) TaxID=192944 RepID=UPI003628AAE6